MRSESLVKRKLQEKEFNIMNFSDVMPCSVIVWLKYTSDIPEECNLFSHHRKSLSHEI
jgi:hypothetical protein